MTMNKQQHGPLRLLTAALAWGLLQGGALGFVLDSSASSLICSAEHQGLDRRRRILWRPSITRRTTHTTLSSLSLSSSVVVEEQLSRRSSRQAQRQQARSLEAKLQREFVANPDINDSDNNKNNASPSRPLLLIVDANNVRGKNDFKWTAGDLIHWIGEWYDEQVRQIQTEQQNADNDDTINLHLVVVWDHSRQTTAIPYRFGSKKRRRRSSTTRTTRDNHHPNDDDDDPHNGLMLFAGPRCTADDVIVHATQFWATTQQSSTTSTLQQSPQVWVVTSDGDLKRRCLRAGQGPAVFLRSRRKGASRKKARIVPTPVAAVQTFASPHLVKGLEKVQQLEDLEQQSSVSTKQRRMLVRLEQDLRNYQSSRPPWKSRSAKEAAEERGPWSSQLFSEHPSGGLNDHAAATFDEKTWHRVLIAETLRQSLLSSQPNESQSSSLPDLLAQYKLHMQREPPTRRRAAVETGSVNKQQPKMPLKEEEEEPLLSMFLDHRIQYETQAQKQMLEYMKLAMETSSEQPKQQPASLDTESTTATPTATPLELAARALQQIVLESGDKSQDQILNRYCREAPSELQFSRIATLRELLGHLAIRERRGGDAGRRWYLRQVEPQNDPQTNDTEDNAVRTASTAAQVLPPLPPLDTLYDVQPGRGRRAQQRQAGSRRQRHEVNMDLVTAGKRVEDEWWTLFQQSSSSINIESD